MFGEWSKRHSVAIGTTFIAAMAAAIAVDLFMVEVLGVASISWRTWVAEELHPTLITAG
jgi:hypothetical protein